MADVAGGLWVRRGQWAWSIAFALWLASGVGAASALEIKVTLMGQAGIEDPQFEVLLNDTFVGYDTVSVAAKSAQGEYLKPGVDLAPFTREYTFEVAEELPPPGEVSIRFLNDYYDAEKGIDANLYVVSVSLDGNSLDLGKAQVIGENGEPRDRIYWDGALALPWVATATIPYEAPAAPQKVEPKVAAVEEPAPKPQAPVCASPGSISITDYPNGETAVSPAGKAQLDKLVAGGLAGCSVKITGYSSPGGPPELNLSVSLARSAAIEAYLRERAPEVASIVSSGAGETSEFGSAAENRRVVVIVE